MENQSFSHVKASPNNTKPSTILVNHKPTAKIETRALLRVLSGRS